MMGKMIGRPMSKAKALFWAVFIGLVVGIPLIWFLSGWTDTLEAQHHRDASESQVQQQNVTPAPGKIPSSEEGDVDSNLTYCLLPKAQYGEYSSYDGGKSARHLLQDECPNEYMAWEESCEAHGDTSNNCVLKSMIIAQAAIKKFGK